MKICLYIIYDNKSKTIMDIYELCATNAAKDMESIFTTTN